jgi:hypothetical protein
MYDDDEDIIDWGSSFRLQTGWQPFTSIDGVVVDPDVVTFGFAYPGATADEVFTWTNGATPPDPTYTIQRKVITITAVTPSDPATGSVLYQSSTPHNYQAPTSIQPGTTTTIAGISPSGYSGVFQVATTPTPNTFTIVNATTGTPTLTSATSTETGSFYMEIDTVAYMPTYISGPWPCYIQGEPGISALDVTQTKVRQNKILFVNGPDC